MKKIAAVLLTFGLVQSAQASHVYASYSCTTKDKKLSLVYDGPGSNYASGGLSNFYTQKAEQGKGILASEISAGSERDSSNIGDEFGEQHVQVTFEFTQSKEIGKGKTEKYKCDPKDESDVGYDHEEWKSVKKVTIKEISVEAALALGVSPGSVIDMACHESTDTPVRCNENDKN